MTQDEITEVLDRAKAGMRLQLAYDSPRGERRFSILITEIKYRGGEITRVSLERGTATWKYLKRAPIKGTGDIVWCFFQPNPYPIYEVGLEGEAVTGGVATRDEATPG